MQVHETIGFLLARTGNWLTQHVSEYFSYLLATPVYFWVPVGIVAVVVVALCYTKFLLALPRRSLMLFVLSGAVYISGSVGVEIAGALHVIRRGRSQDLVYVALYTIEETLEMAGIALFLFALLKYAESEIGSIRLRLCARTSKPIRVD